MTGVTGTFQQERIMGRDSDHDLPFWDIEWDIIRTPYKQEMKDGLVLVVDKLDPYFYVTIFATDGSKVEEDHTMNKKWRRPDVFGSA